MQPTPVQELNDIARGALDALQRIRFRVRQTPLDISPWLSKLGDCQCFLKLESEQHTGSFKARGAVNKVTAMSLSPDAGFVDSVPLCVGILVKWQRCAHLMLQAACTLAMLSHVGCSTAAGFQAAIPS